MTKVKGVTNYYELANLVRSYKIPIKMRNRKDSLFKLQSFRNGCVDDILQEISSSDHKEDTISFMERYRHKMDVYACTAKTSLANTMFSVSYDLATEILDDLICERRFYIHENK